MRLFFARKFRKEYDRLPIKLKKRCDDRLRLFAAEPFHTLLENHLLHPPYRGCRSINVTGDYRAIYVGENEHVVRFIRVGTHHELFGT